MDSALVENNTEIKETNWFKQISHHRKTGVEKRICHKRSVILTEQKHSAKQTKGKLGENENK